jgi:hypothetical protein
VLIVIRYARVVPLQPPRAENEAVAPAGSGGATLQFTMVLLLG